MKNLSKDLNHITKFESLFLGLKMGPYTLFPCPLSQVQKLDLYR